MSGNVTFLTHIQSLLARLLLTLSQIAKAMAEDIADLDAIKADKREIIKPETVNDGVVFKDGNGVVIYKIPVMK